MTKDEKRARERIAVAEQDLKRQLSDGERRDLLKDNFDWRSDYVRVIVAMISSRDLRRA